MSRKQACFTLRRTWLALFLGGAAIAAPGHVYAQSGAASEATARRALRQFDIAPGSLDTVLGQFGRQAGVFIGVDSRLTQGRQSRGLSGAHDVARGFEILLEGTGLQAVESERGKYVLRLVPAGQAQELEAVTVRGSAERDATSEGTGSYAAQGATILKGARSLKDIPQSVTVITRQQMDDQALNTLDDVLANTTGITLVKRPGGGNDIYARGFMTNTIQYDGVPLARGSYWGNAFAASSVYLDRVEVLRGAQGLLEGAGNPAGAVNVVRKRGMADKAFWAEVRAGSWDNYGTRLEAGGPLDEDGKIRSRVVLDYEDRGYFVDTIGDRNLNTYVALDFDVAPDTTLGIGLAHARLKGNRSLYDGVPRYANGQALDIPRSTYVGANWNNADRKETQLFVDLEHRFSPDWKFKITGVYVKEDWHSIQSNGHGTVALGGTTVNGTGYIYDYGATSMGFDASLSGKFKLLGAEQDIVLGANYSRQKRDDGYTQYLFYTTYDAFNPNHDMPPLSASTPTATAHAMRKPVQKGLYGMLRSHLTDDLTLVLGARASWFEREDAVATNGGAATVTTAKESGEVTPYAGLVYALTPQWSVYASYADIFQPQTATDAQFQVLPPIIGVNYEAGIKGELFDGALNASLAVFRVDQKNRAVADYDAPRVCGSAGTSWCSRASGKVRSEGIELEAHGTLAKGWQISAGYTYNRNKYLADNDAALIGKPFDYKTPKHILRVWTDYQLPGKLNQWHVGAGVNYQSARETDTIRQQGGFSVWNARVAYQIDRNWSAALNVNNVFDKRYYSYMDDWFYNSYFGEPRNFMLTLRGRF